MPDWTHHWTWKALIYLSTHSFGRCLLVFLGISKKKHVGIIGKMWETMGKHWYIVHQKSPEVQRHIPVFVHYRHFKYFFIWFETLKKKNTYPQLSTQVSTIFLFSVCCLLSFFFCKPQDGEVYYWNRETNETTWSRPFGGRRSSLVSIQRSESRCGARRSANDTRVWPKRHRATLKLKLSWASNRSLIHKKVLKEYSPEIPNMELWDFQPFEKEIHFPNLHFWVPC